MKFAPVLFVLSCGPAIHPAGATCETPCGLRFVGEFQDPDKYPAGSPRWSCQAFDATERAVLGVFPSVDDARFRFTCSTLTGWTVEMDPRPYWKRDGYVKDAVWGWADCTAGAITIGNNPPDTDVLPHELAHAVQSCRPNACTHPGVDPDSSHDCWSENGVTAAIGAAVAEVKRSLGGTR